MGKSKIEWTDRVWNPVTGCTKVSAGCKYCYAERLAGRFWGERPFTDVRLHPERLDMPGKWKQPQRIFVNSMSDLFHEKLDLTHILTIFYRMATYDQHTYIVLTKRPKRMVEFFDYWKEYIELCKAEGYGFFSPPLPNVWLGVSVENQAAADERIPLLMQTPAAVRFVSCEPLLGPVDIYESVYKSPREKFYLVPPKFSWLKSKNIDWVIAGGESGPDARPMHPDWARSLRDQCREAAVPFFFKQWGEWIERSPDLLASKTVSVSRRDGAIGDSSGVYRFGDNRNACFRAEKRDDTAVMSRVGKRAAGRLLDGRIWDEYPKGGE
jgi:protein gp37